MKSIEEIKVYLDDNIPEDMNGIIRIGSVIINFDDGAYQDCDILVGNEDFNTVDSYDLAIVEMKDYIINNLSKYVAEYRTDLSNLTMDIINIYEN